MSGVIKSKEILEGFQTVRSLGQESEPKLVSQLSANKPLQSNGGRSDLEVKLYEENESLKLELKRLQDEIEVVSEQSFSAGKEAATKSFKQNHDEAVTRLEGAIQRSFTDIDQTLNELKLASIDLCHLAFEKIFADKLIYQDIVEQFVCGHLNRLRSDNILSIELSVLDFSNEDALNDMKNKIGNENISIKVSDSIPSGSCRAQLEFGEMELSLESYRDKLNKIMSSYNASEMNA